MAIDMSVKYRNANWSFGDENLCDRWQQHWIWINYFKCCCSNKILFVWHMQSKLFSSALASHNHKKNESKLIVKWTFFICAMKKAAENIFLFCVCRESFPCIQLFILTHRYEQWAHIDFTIVHFITWFVYISAHVASVIFQ